MLIHRRSASVGSPFACQGFTMIEVLVTIGIVGTLLSILIPAVQHARESARRIGCTSNLRQIILAYHEVEESTGRFPGLNRGDIGPTGLEHWHIEILPYLEEIKPSVDRKTGQVLRSPGPIATYACPSDPYAQGTAGALESSYYPNVGRSREIRDGFYKTQEGGPIRAADVTDGLSNTAALSEHLALPGGEYTARQENRFDDPIFARRIVRKFSTTTGDLNTFADQCQTQSDVPLVAVYSAGQYDHVQTPNKHSCWNRADGAPILMTLAASSMHGGGVNVAMGDGAVRFVSDSIDRHIWRALGSRNGSERIEDLSF
ncbi:DUF1559 family PulG-like putative transporter [Planctomicrobium sp. SH527]|uniref:DUF1559 family PulG-like putative transporter n=1 Tax=Planctomicrobium sp. SH527 TaxID=3448123 RepID=UPI003F5BF3D4